MFHLDSQGFGTSGVDLLAVLSSIQSVLIHP